MSICLAALVILAILGIFQPNTELFKVNKIKKQQIFMNVQKIREDFPILKEKLNGKPIIYMDSACMTLKPKQVVEAMNEYYYKYSACAGRSIHKLGNIVSEKYQQARENIAKFLGTKKAEEIVFTRNTTEGLNLVLKSFDLKKGDVVLTTDKEHNSCLLPILFLSKEKGIKHEIVFSKDDGTFDMEKFQEKMNKSVKLVSMVHTSNLDGYTIPAKDIVKIAHDNGALVMLDGAQSASHKQLSVKDLDVDFFACSGHKMLGPTGTGVLYGKYHLLEELKPFIVGGDTVERTTYDSYKLLPPPEKFEAGLQNYAGFIGLGKAVEYITRVGKGNIEKNEKDLNSFLTKEMSQIPALHLIGPESPELRSGIVSFTIDGMDYHDIALMLSNVANIMIRSGQHCVHSWFDAKGISGSARISLYLYNTRDEAQTLLNTLHEIIKLR